MNKILLVLVLISASVVAQIPYTFKSGETAKASEVNENLTYLNGRIDSLIPGVVKITEINSRIDSLKKLNTKLDSLMLTAAKITEINSLTDSLKHLNTKLDSLKQTAAKVTAINSLMDSVKYLNTRIDSLKTGTEKITGINSRIDSLVKAMANKDTQISGLLASSTALNDSLKNLRTKLKADSTALAKSDSANQLTKGTIAAFLTEPGADGYLPGSNSAWMFAAGQGEVNGVTVPDLRGRFLRGIDYIVTGHAATNLDPDGLRTPGEQQGDAFQIHTHKTGVQGPVGSGGGQGYSVAYDNLTMFTHQPNSEPIKSGNNANPRTASETRPVNTAVFWYVKVK